MFKMKQYTDTNFLILVEKTRATSRHLDSLGRTQQLILVPLELYYQIMKFTIIIYLYDISLTRSFFIADAGDIGCDRLYQCSSID